MRARIASMNWVKIWVGRVIVPPTATMSAPVDRIALMSRTELARMLTAPDCAAAVANRGVTPPLSECMGSPGNVWHGMMSPFVRD